MAAMSLREFGFGETSLSTPLYIHWLALCDLSRYLKKGGDCAFHIKLSANKSLENLRVEPSGNPQDLLPYAGCLIVWERGMEPMGL